LSVEKSINFDHPRDIFSLVVNNITQMRTTFNFSGISFQDLHLVYGGSATWPLSRDGGVEELHGDPIVGPGLKVWTRGQKWK